MSTTLITNGIVVDAGTMRPLDILISGERVESLLPRGSEVRADRVIDASGRYVLPGIIDAHNHPVYADRIDRLSRAALSGGVTTVIPYIGAVAAWGKQGGLVQAIDDFIREGETGSCIDFGLHCTLTANVMEEADEAIPELVARGVISFKAFTSYRKRGMKLEDDQILHLAKRPSSPSMRKTTPSLNIWKPRPLPRDGSTPAITPRRIPTFPRPRPSSACFRWPLSRAATST